MMSFHILISKIFHGLAIMFLTSTLIVGCKMDKTAEKVPPHMQKLAAFDPHVSSFKCQIEVSKVPPVDAQADDWFLEARALEDSSIFIDDRDHKKIVQLTRQAAERHHWKAMLNLASLYVEGRDPPNSEHEALMLVSQAIELGVPAAYDRMGTYYLNGTGVHVDATRAYAFFQKAAEMGNPQAMAFLGEKMDAAADGIKPGYWSNIPVAIQMFECALAQGYGPAAEELKYMYAVPRGPDGKELGGRNQETRNRVMQALHEGVKGGCMYCANHLATELSDPVNLENMYVPLLDKARGERYAVLREALGFNPDRRFPNLDRILPLPPASLPSWDGQRDSLLKAAMAVTPKLGTPEPTEASLKKGRFFLDSAYGFRPVEETTDALQAPFSSYWRPIAPTESTEVRAFLSKIPPGLYQKGEAFEQPRYPSGFGSGPIKHIVWQRVVTVRNNNGAVEPRSAAGLASEVTRPEPHLQCSSHVACPATGIWQPWLPPGHPLEQAVNQTWRQRWLTAGQPFPDPKRDWMLPVNNNEVTWHLLHAETPRRK
jgi:hypothetical protein